MYHLNKYSSTQCCTATFKVIGLPVPEKNFLKDFYHTWTRRPSWSCDLDHLNKVSFLHPEEASQEILLQSAQWLLRKRSLNILNLKDLDQGQRMTLTINIQTGSYTYLVDCIYEI